MRPADSFLGQPVRSLQTMLRVLAEDDPSLPTVVPDGIYGPTTMAAVTELQRRENLPLTGITDQQTWERIAQLYEPALIRTGKAEPIEIIMEPGQVFRLGDDGPYIYLMQTLLIWLARDHADIPSPDHTGIFDEKTQNALSGFQRLAGLPETGALDKVTWKNLSRHFSLNAHHNAQRRIISAVQPETNLNFLRIFAE
ncbi:MAG: peptidoglycan-binding protein [Oscillospiraceae bacterium]|nr:peptidoglycan-binding protein [Oscillospiraceae bacterium]